MGFVKLTLTEERKHRRLSSQQEKLAFLDQVNNNRRLITLARQHGDWNGFISLHEPREKFKAFQEVHGKLSDQEYWAWLGQIWRELPARDYLVAALLFSSNRPHQQGLMTEEEYSFYRNGLPDQILLYSGKGISWRLTKGAPRGTQVCRKLDVLALFDRGLYYEVIVDPDALRP